ncbi:bifunctional diaminohydroxyphosphoribosylaminopyrimidine deaminase/5-amino-6-(5-phosphoribosylamino)uracil reductase RibD [Pusillimonas noertemannii]|uniref:bifunctional diaminohydroxyphosphoribosylaminopyrimidine deaminase/5-amino-6-(5-phosphoribosylamino)uracil reductase RibD n=1 Tax=Pusillimonas noertemannii TaxID=305977 RepID=UPI0002E09D44|nr:bifunctional diaminohydroxyphosphoribosylaminopyrimidine deaminase/5-amino-6-(5-phosphoribosylamino)uracil reductase RibD [Pusillimonas noertemannii]
MNPSPHPPSCDSDEAWMRRAIALSRQSLYITTPNPRVACLIVRDGRLLASGVTQKAGGPHAEVMALRQARENGVSTQGATFYVTLEPCSHHGRTPPCVDALIQAQPARVVVAMADPNPLVSGRGLAKLKAAGIAVSGPLCAAEALEVNPGFVARMTRGTPWVWLKTAASLDGRTALDNGASQWITGPQARADGHHWRARSCVVLTGAGTVLADDPQLNVREVETTRQPIKAVIDTGMQVPESARLFDGSPVWVFTAGGDPAKAQRLAERNVQVVRMPLDNGRVHLPSVLQWLGRHDINEVHVEAGSVLSGALLQAGCVDELLVYLAPMLLGAGRPMAELPVLHDLEQALRFEFHDQASLGGDVRLLARKAPAWRSLLDAVSAVAGA